MSSPCQTAMGFESENYSAGMATDVGAPRTVYCDFAAPEPPRRQIGGIQELRTGWVKLLNKCIASRGADGSCKIGLKRIHYR